MPPKSAVPGMALAAQDFDRIRDIHSDGRKGIDKDNAKKMAALKARITKHYQTEVSKRSSFIGKRLERLAEAIEQKNACEEAIQKLAVSHCEKAERLVIQMDAIFMRRGQDIQFIATSTLPTENT